MKIIKNLKEIIKYKLCFFKKRKFGENNKDKIFFVIKDNSPYVGVLSEWFRLCTVLNFAIKHEFILIIDFRNCLLPQFSDKEYFEKENFWEYYFKQPSKYTLDEVYKSKNVIYCPNIWSKCLNVYSILGNYSGKPLASYPKEFINNLNNWYLKMPLSSDIIRMADFYYDKFFPKNEKILGVSYRAAYEVLHKLNSFITPPGTHPVKVTSKNIISEIESKLKLLNYNYFFLSIDDREVCDAIKNHFGDKCIITDRKLQHQFKDGEPIDVMNHLELLTQEYKDFTCPNRYITTTYLAEVYLLSRCNSLLAKGGSSDLFALIINNCKYENVFD